MKHLTLLFLLASLIASAQPKGEWTKVKDMNNNGSVTEWRYIIAEVKEIVTPIALSEKPKVKSPESVGSPDSMYWSTLSRVHRTTTTTTTTRRRYYSSTSSHRSVAHHTNHHKTNFWRGDASWGSAGTVTTISSGKLSPKFTTSVSSSTTTPAVSVTIMGSNTGSDAAPKYLSPSISANQGTATTVLHGSGNGNPSWSKVTLKQKNK